MFSVSSIISGLYGLVGLRQPDNPDYDILDASNITSRSGYYSNDNPYCKAEFILDNVDYISATDPQKNTMIKRMQESAIVDVCNRVFDGADYIDRNVLYKNAINLKDTETIPVGFVGYEIEVDDEKNLAFEITRMTFNFSGTGTLKLLLFHNSTSSPIQSKTVTITTSHHVESLKWVVDNSGNYYKGKYYLGYLSNSITGTLVPYKRDYDDSNIKSCIRFLKIESVYVPNQTTETIWDLSLNQSGTGDCYGLNPDITVYYDYTDLILRNEKLFAKAIDLAFQIRIINSYLTSLRSNKNERMSSEFAEKALVELNGVVTANSILNKIGLIPMLRNELLMLKPQIEKLKSGYFSNNEPRVITLS